MDTSRTFVDRFELLRAHAASITVTARSIVERIAVVSDVWQRKLSAFIDMFLMRSFFKLLKNDSATVFSRRGRLRRTAMSTASSTSSRRTVGAVH